MRRVLQIAALLLALTPMIAPVFAIEIPIAGFANSAGGSADFDPSILIGKPLSTDDGVTIGTVTEVIVIAVGQFLIIAQLNEGFADGQRTVQISSRAASFTKEGVRLDTTADAFRKSLQSQTENGMGSRAD